MKIDLFLSTWDTTSHRLARVWHAIRGHARSMSRERARPTDNPPQVHGSIDRLSCTGYLTQGWGYGGTEAWRVKGERGTDNRFGRCTVYEWSVCVSIPWFYTRAFLQVI